MCAAQTRECQPVKLRLERLECMDGVTPVTRGSLCRVYVIGGAGSGKTTLARRLSEALGVPHVELDAGGNLSELVHKPAWVAEGVFPYGINPVLDRAEVIVWLDLPRRVCLRRIVTRHVRLSVVGRNNHPGLGLLVRFLQDQWRYYTSKARELLGRLGVGRGSASTADGER